MSDNTDSRPNFVIIMSDQHSRSAMGCMGDLLASTPSMDHLAKSGVVFENFYSNSPLCLPARMAFLTSRHPYGIKCWDNLDALASDVPTFAHALGSAGYETVLSGRMHIVGPDQYHGFESRPIGDFHSTWLWAGWNLKRVLGPLVDTPGMARASMEKSGPGQTGYMMYDERIRDVTIKWISDRSNRKDETRPFCLVVGFVAPHCPFVCPKKYFDRHFSNMTLPNIPPGHLENLHPLHKKIRRDSRIENLTDMEIRRTRAAYYGLVEWFDNLMGSVLEALQRNGLMENTVIMYTSDHGDQIGEHGLWWKSTFYEGSIGVPLIVSWPEQIEGGRRILENASLINIGPTLTDLAGAPDIPYASGQSFKPLLFGDDSNWQDEVFAEYHYPPQRMLRQGQWKLNVYLDYLPQLFNLSEDPDEFHDQAHNRECKDIMKSMMDRVMKGWDPEAVKEEINRKNNERALLGEWVKVVKPYDPLFWPKEGDPLPVNRIESCPEAGQEGVFP